MTAVFLVCMVILGISGTLVVIRITRGPTTLDRAVGLDVVISILICGIAVEAAVNRHSTTLPALLVLTLVGFVGSVSIARFSRGRSDDVEGEPG